MSLNYEPSKMRLDGDALPDGVGKVLADGGEEQRDQRRLPWRLSGLHGYLAHKKQRPPPRTTIGSGVPRS